MAALFDTLPAGYRDAYLTAARSGARVIALGWRKIDLAGDAAARKVTLEEAECGLQFAGLLLLDCPMKKDTPGVIRDLADSNHTLVMLTGDNPLTAVSVARKLGMLSYDALLLTVDGDGQEGQLEEEEEAKHADAPPAAACSLVWESSDGKSRRDYSPELLEEVSSSHSLAVSGAALAAVAEQHGEAAHDALCAKVAVFARVSPTQKEAVMRLFKQAGRVTLYCGDGTNDVGALKQAHVGVSIINNPVLEAKWDEGREKGIDMNLLLAVRGKNKKQSMAAVRRLARRNPAAAAAAAGGDDSAAEAGGKPSVHSSVRARRRAAEARRSARKKPSKRPAAPGMSAHMAQLAEMMEELEDEESTMVKLGDASIASPFTSKTPSISATTAIIRQGRCTLVTTMQMYKILALQCLITAYSLSVLYLDGIKLGDQQASVSALLIAGFFLFLSRAKPLQQLSPRRPVARVFHPSIMLSLLAQFAAHLATLMLTVSWCRPFIEEGDPSMEPDGDFKPNIINSVVFLVSHVLTVNTFVVNYKGYPFMEGLADNKPMRMCALFSYAVPLAALLGVPGVDDILELVPLPTLGFRAAVAALLAADTAVAWLLDRAICRVFEP
eukprot:PLAT14238.2.p1 GENE.PLAT14238.2~~PLAT14238.2.p1  ORF type:complete len:640 (-),score=382.99 PLAT14238.2:55-1884(-)